MTYQCTNTNALGHV